MDFIPHEIRQYAEAHTTEESPLLKAVAAHTRAHVSSPRMLSGHLQGRILALLSRIVRPSFVLDIGTYTGYSTLCLAEGLRDSGKIITIDNNPALQKKTSEFFARSPWHQQIDFRLGEAAKIIPHIKHPLDLVFIDADKKNYSLYYDLVIDQITTGGCIVADNVLWSGNVLAEPAKRDEQTEALVAFSRKVHTDARVDNVLLPVRDGLMVVRKLPA